VIKFSFSRSNNIGAECHIPSLAEYIEVEKHIRGKEPVDNAVDPSDTNTVVAVVVVVDTFVVDAGSGS